MKNATKLIMLTCLFSVTSFFYSCSNDENQNEILSENSKVSSNSSRLNNDWENFVTKNESATKENSIVFNTQEEYIEYVKKLNEDINNSELLGNIELVYNDGRGFAARGGCADGNYYGSAMSSGFATLGFDVSVSGGCITGVSGSFSGMTLGISYSQGGSSIGCNSASVCGSVNYNFFVEGIGTVYSRRVCYNISLNC